MSTWTTELFSELHYKETFACGTCRSYRKNMPKSVTKAKLKKRKANMYSEEMAHCCA